MRETRGAIVGLKIRARRIRDHRGERSTFKRDAWNNARKIRRPWTYDEIWKCTYKAYASTTRICIMHAFKWYNESGAPLIAPSFVQGDEQRSEITVAIALDYGKIPARLSKRTVLFMLRAFGDVALFSRWDNV